MMALVLVGVIWVMIVAGVLACVAVLWSLMIVIKISITMWIFGNPHNRKTS